MTDRRAAFLTPFRAPARKPWDTGFAYREEAFAWQQAEYRRRGLDSFVADDGKTEGPFSLAAAANRAFAAVPRDGTFSHVVLLGADHAVPTNAEIADVLHRASGLPGSTGWAPLFGRTQKLSRPATEAVLAGRHDVREPKLHLSGSARFCTGPMAVEIDKWELAGGMDERFDGWGYEDNAWRERLVALFGEPLAAPPTAVCRTLWHPVGDRDPALTGRNKELLAQVRAELAQLSQQPSEVQLELGADGDS